MKKLISWNVNGLRACMEKGFLTFFNEIDADIFCLQETKLQQGQIFLDLPGYHQYWNYAEKRDIPGRLLSRRKNLYLFPTDLVLKNTTMKEGLSLWNLSVSI